jgi:dolichyl-phosphate-mannose-protein mannosyltransferase
MNLDALLGRARDLARSGWKMAIAWGPQMSHPLTGFLLAFMVFAGIVLRIQNVGYPFQYCFDEDGWAGAAHQLLVGVPTVAECCHPPFTEILLGVGMLLFGNNPLGWRFMPLCFGIQCIVLVFFLARALFEDRRAGWLAAAFMAADGFYLSFSRLAFSEGLLAPIILWSLLAAVTARGWGGVLTSAVLVGAAASIKWVGLLAGLPACFAILMLRRAPWYSIFSFAVVPFVHVAIWMIGLRLVGHPSDFMSVVDEVRRRANSHLGFTRFANPLESTWYTWLVLYHPFVIKSSQVGAKIRLASSIGNPLLWVTAHACLFALPLVGGVMAVRARWRERWLQWFDRGSSKAVAILGVSWVCMMLLWFSGRISTYWYHYLTCWGITLTLFSAVVARLDRRFPKAVLIFVILVLAISIYFAPVWAEIPISVSAAHRRLIFPLWR